MVTGLFDHITVSGVMSFIYFMDFVISLFIIFFDNFIDFINLII